MQIDWSGFYTNERRDRIPLPTYPFERQRYWIEPPKLGQTIHPGQISLEKKPDIADWFYIPVWKKSMPPVPFEVGSLAEQTSCWLLFVDECGVGLQIAQRLEGENQDVISVKLGEQFSQLSEREYTINPRSRDDYSVLLKDLVARNKLPKTIVHSWNVELDERARSGIELFKEAQNLGFYSLLFLTQALEKQLITDPLQLWVLSNGIHEIESTDVLYPEKATLLGLCNVIPQEYTNITCRSIDLVLPRSNSRQEEKLIDQILTELTAPSSDLTVAYRGNHRWLQDFESVRLDDKTERRTRLRPGGVYPIAGGLGKLGLMLAKYLAQSVQAKLSLIGRSGLPAKEEWEQWLATHDRHDRVSIRIKKVQELEELGAEVLVIGADVANEAQMQAAIAQTEARFGKINGVIYAAGIVDKESLTTISETSYAECELHFQPKVYGIYTLEKVLRGRELDYCLLISSVSSILGGLGFAAYSSANIFLDAFARKQNQFNDNNWCSADWFSVDVPEENVEAFQRILSQCTLSQIVISQNCLKTQINKWIKRQSWQGQEKDPNGRVESSPYLRSNLKNAFVAPSSETEHRIAKRYQELLGIEQVGVHDNFFDLGGNSLIGTQMFSRLRQDLQTELPLRLLFESPTVAQLALAIEKIIIGELEKLTEEEVRDLVPDIPNQEQASMPINDRRYKLPNNLEILYQSQAETDYFYKDIFENQVYLKHGITLNDGDCIFDVGANIGLFTLFVNQQCSNAKIYSFEPAPPLFEILRLNTELHKVNGKLFDFGLSNEAKTATFTFYPSSSGMSSFFADRQEEKQVLKAIMLNQLQSGMAGMEQVMEYSDELLEERFKSKTFTCQLRTLSEAIAENNVESIDLLKIDVQKSEFDVIKGIKNNDWEKIEQIVIEVHDREGQLGQIVDLLRIKGYEVVVEQEDLYEGSNIYNVYAIRSSDKQKKSKMTSHLKN
jgi:FkbM family methyltransferase